MLLDLSSGRLPWRLQSRYSSNLVTAPAVCLPRCLSIALRSLLPLLYHVPMNLSGFYRTPLALLPYLPKPSP